MSNKRDRQLGWIGGILRLTPVHRRYFNPENPEYRKVLFIQRLKLAGNVKHVLGLVELAAGMAAPGGRWLYFIEVLSEPGNHTPAPRFVIGHADPMMLTVTLLFRTDDRAAADKTWTDMQAGTSAPKANPDVIDI